MPVCSPKLTGPCLGRLSYLCQLRHSLSPGAECGLEEWTLPDPRREAGEARAPGGHVPRETDDRWTGSEETDIN